MKRVFFVALLIACIASVHARVNAQSTKGEEKKIQHIKWKTTKVGKGMRVKTTELELFNSPQQIFMLVIDTAKAKVNYAVGMPDFMEKTSVQAASHHAIAAINGSFFRNHSEPLGSSMHFIVIDGKTVATTDSTEFNFRAKGSVMVRNNSVDISDWTREKEKEFANNANYAMVSGPLLMDNNRSVELDSIAFNMKRHPRSFMAFAEGHLLWVVVDGRSEQAAGMNLEEVRFFGQSLGLY